MPSVPDACECSCPVHIPVHCSAGLQPASQPACLEECPGCLHCTNAARPGCAKLCPLRPAVCRQAALLAGAAARVAAVRSRVEAALVGLRGPAGRCGRRGGIQGRCAVTQVAGFQGLPAALAGLRGTGVDYEAAFRAAAMQGRVQADPPSWAHALVLPGPDRCSNSTPLWAPQPGLPTAISQCACCMPTRAGRLPGAAPGCSPLPCAAPQHRPLG